MSPFVVAAALLPLPLPPPPPAALAALAALAADAVLACLLVRAFFLFTVCSSLVPRRGLGWAYTGGVR